ncbi:MAG: DNA polymerase III subunit gamma/tau [Candidatus Paceibacterota bacterium]
MLNLALYRKYRPQKFSDIVGQDHIVSVLAGAVKSDKFAHAYLFSGSRGLGKTSIARILARALGTDDKDLYEIDGASNRGIEEIRALRDGVRTMPFTSKFKVYIIDEVHMLTTPAFNALLKTLEEPPPHVIFILATTELAKVPETIISRCETHVFKKPSPAALVKLIKQIAVKEGYQIEESAAELLAFLGDGSFRDTIGALQKAIAGSRDKKIITAEVEKVTGAPPLLSVFAFLRALLAGRADEALAVIRRLTAEGSDVRLFAKLLLRYLRLAMLFKFAPNATDELTAGLGEDETTWLKEIITGPQAASLPKILKEFLDAYDQITFAYLPELPLELAVIKIIDGFKAENDQV